MRNKFKSACATTLLMGGVMLTQDSAAQTWTTEDYFSGDFSFNRAVGLETDPSRTLLFSFGCSSIDEVNRRAGAVRVSMVDAVDPWEPLHLWLPDTWDVAEYLGACVAAPSTALPSGAFFLAGTVGDNIGESSWLQNWFVRRSTDGGLNWDWVDLVGDGTSGMAGCRSVRAAPSGVVFACGSTRAQDRPSWLLRKSSDGGTSWENSDLLSVGYMAEAMEIAFHPNDTILVIGWVLNSNADYVWTTRRSTDGGATWQNVDTYQVGREDAQGCAITTDDVGNIYAAGFSKGWRKRGAIDLWMVRRSADGGQSWSTVDSYTLPTTTSYNTLDFGPTAITTTSGGHVWVCGYYTASDGSLRWLVRRGVPGAKGSFSWKTMDDFQLAPRQPARANGIVADAYGNIWVSGRAADATGKEHWLTRKLAVGQF